ncbi:LacI family transcriptional regulator [Streptacidiphilus sp. 4-A2]|nr:LacI family transcriptional regulator [Streptacidiphilus sp. 4-A2]
MTESTGGAPPAAPARPTLLEVAALAGVSRATVSRVVNGGAGVRASVQARVRQAVEELGYVPNPAARALMTRRHNAVAVVIAEPESRVFSDPFFARQLRGISRELASAEVQLVLLLIAETGDYAQVGGYLSAGHVDGVLVFSLHADDPLPALVDRLQLPAVYGGRPGWAGTDGDTEDGADAAAADGAGPADGALYVDADNLGGARTAVRHLVERGRRTIAVITGPLDQTSAADRLRGYREVLPDADPALCAVSDFTAPGGRRAMEQLLARRPDLDAVFVCSDLMASGALAVLREHGRAVPEDVAVVGFDDLEAAELWAPLALTTVHQDIEGMGRLMARLLLTRIELAFTGRAQEAAALRPVVTPARLVVRATS